VNVYKIETITITITKALDRLDKVVGDMSVSVGQWYVGVCIDKIETITITVNVYKIKPITITKALDRLDKVVGDMSVSVGL
jgi:hypothetical protein